MGLIFMKLNIFDPDFIHEDKYLQNAVRELSQSDKVYLIEEFKLLKRRKHYENFNKLKSADFLIKKQQRIFFVSIL